MKYKLTAYVTLRINRHKDKEALALFLLSENSPKFKKAARVKVNAHALGVGFYSYMCARLSPIPTESVDEV